MREKNVDTSNKNKKNRMLYVNQSDIAKIAKAKTLEDYYIVKISGKSIQSEQAFLDYIADKFSFPDRDGWDVLCDWMRDLSWISSRRLCIIIYDYSDLFNSDEIFKAKFDDYFTDILMFWEKDVVNMMVDGKKRSFDIYLVD